MPTASRSFSFVPESVADHPESADNSREMPDISGANNNGVHYGGNASFCSGCSPARSNLDLLCHLLSYILFTYQLSGVPILVPSH